MKILSKTKEGRLDFFRELFRNAEMQSADSLNSLDKWMKQYKGSDKIDGSRERALTVRNITYEIVESQVSSDIPQPKADAVCYSEKRSRNAESIERLCRSLRDRLPYEVMNDIDERYTYIYGGSVWYAEWDHTAEYCGEIGSVKVHCLSPKDLVPQPGIYSIDGMEYCFLKFTSTRGETERKYGLTPEQADELEFDFEYGTESTDGDTVRIILCFYKDEMGRVGRYIYSGDVCLSDLPGYYMRKAEVCKRCGLPAHKCRCGCTESVIREVSCETVPKELAKEGMPRTVPYYIPNRFPIVVRRNTSGENTLLGQSDCDYIRYEQQAINKVESRILQKLLRAAVTPIMPEDTTVSISNAVFGQVIKMKPGESVAQYGKVDTTPDISQDITEAERLYDHAKRVAGISDAFQGIDNRASESGYAKQLRISQATGRLESKRKMKHTAYAEMDRIIFELYLAFADEPRQLSYKDAYGRIHSAVFNRYDFLELDERTGEFYYDDGYLFSVDLNGGAEYQREALWQRNLENLKAGTLGSPESNVTLLRYWQCQERAHYPYARENVEYFKQAIEEERRNGYGTEEYISDRIPGELLQKLDEKLDNQEL